MTFIPKPTLRWAGQLAFAALVVLAPGSGTTATAGGHHKKVERILVVPARAPAAEVRTIEREVVRYSPATETVRVIEVPAAATQRDLELPKDRGLDQPLSREVEQLQGALKSRALDKPSLSARGPGGTVTAPAVAQREAAPATRVVERYIVRERIVAPASVPLVVREFTVPVPVYVVEPKHHLFHHYKGW